MNDESFIHVAVGVIKNEKAQILISLRDKNAHQGGLWEFPGGKVETGESIQQALQRELKEELGIAIKEIQPLMQIKHQYEDLKVLLDVWVIKHFVGLASGQEGQKIKWVNSEQLTQYAFPEANKPIITAVKLPAEYAILNAADEALLRADLKKMLDDGVKLIQARLKSLSLHAVMRFFQFASPLCAEKSAILMINSAVQQSQKLAIEGVHLTSSDLLALQQRPAGYLWVAASCHNKLELQHAQRIGVDFAVLAPVLATTTHPDSRPLGWEKAAELISAVNIPVYVLGGMTQQHKIRAQSIGAQGIAGITAFC